MTLYHTQRQMQKKPDQKISFYCPFNASSKIMNVKFKMKRKKTPGSAATLNMSMPIFCSYNFDTHSTFEHIATNCVPIQWKQETGRLAAMDLVEVNPALAKTEADLGTCRGCPGYNILQVIFVFCLLR